MNIKISIEGFKNISYILKAEKINFLAQMHKMLIGRSAEKDDFLIKLIKLQFLLTITEVYFHIWDKIQTLNSCHSSNFPFILTTKIYITSKTNR